MILAYINDSFSIPPGNSSDNKAKLQTYYLAYTIYMYKELWPGLIVQNDESFFTEQCRLISLISGDCFQFFTAQLLLILYIPMSND